MKKKIILVVIICIIVFLMLPFIFKTKSHRPLVGPKLTDLQYSEVFFYNRDLLLAGMLFVPDGAGPFPAAVIIHGSGTSRRDNPWYLTIASHLQKNGIAVLLPDKRGSEKSKGDWTKASFQDLASDTLAAVQFLKSQEQFTCNAVGLLGMSQGGWIAPIAAAGDNRISFVISMSGAGVSTDKQLLFEEVNNITGFGTYRFIARIIAPITVKAIKKKAFWRLIEGFDPLPYWKKVTVPVFVAFGAGDENVPVEESVQRFRSLNMDSMITKVYPGGGHAISDPKTNKISSDFLTDMTSFIKQHVKKNGWIDD